MAGILETRVVNTLMRGAKQVAVSESRAVAARVSSNAPSDSAPTEVQDINQRYFVLGFSWLGQPDQPGLG